MKIKTLLACSLFLASFFSAKECLSESYVVKFKTSDVRSKAKSDMVLSKFAAKPVFKNLISNKSTDNILNSDLAKAEDELRKYYTIEASPATFESTLKELQETGEVESVTPNLKFHVETLPTPNDPLFGVQWALKQIDAQKAWVYATGKGIKIAIVDTGIEFTHPDLLNQLAINAAEDINRNNRFDPWPSTETRDGVTGDLDGIDQDGNGFADDVIGYDFVDQSVAQLGDASGPDPIPADEHGHGTMMGGVIAGESGNKIGITGLAYGAKIMSVRAFDLTGDGESDDMAAAIVYAAMNGARVISCSFGEYYNSPLLEAAVKFAALKGCVIAASSGNNGNDKPHYPSDYEDCISVGASAQEGVRWGLSSYGPRLALLAPGSRIMTTKIGATYSDQASGTSFAAPHVAATAAMLLEVNPDLKPCDIKNILQTTAQKAQYEPWNVFEGSGILNVAAALEFANTGDVSLSSPKNDATILRSDSVLNIVGSVYTPLFDGYTIKIGEGSNPKKWIYESSKTNKAVLNSILGFVKLDKFKDTLYTVCVSVSLKNGTTLDARSRVYFTSKGALKTSTPKAYSCYFEGESASAINVVTSTPTFCKIALNKFASAEAPIYVNDNFEMSQNHLVVISNEIEPGVMYTAKVTCYYPGGDTVTKSINISRQVLSFSTQGFTKKKYSAPFSYICPDVKDVNGDGKLDLFACDISAIAFGKTFMYSFDGTKFTALDSMDSKPGTYQQIPPMIPVQIGNFTGEGSPELLTSASGITRIYKSKTTGTSPFKTPIFSSAENTTFWGEGLFDFNGDGKDEMIIRKDLNYSIYSYNGSSFQKTATTKLPGYLDSIGVEKGATACDLDGDKYPVLAYSNGSGNLFVSKYINGAFNLVFADTSDWNEKYQMLANGDFNGDGKKEIIQALAGPIPARNFTGGQLWNIKMLSSQGDGKYKFEDIANFYGTRRGILGGPSGGSYKNGISAYDVDGDGKDELILSLYPNLYVLKYDPSDSKFKPMWRYPATYSNAAIFTDMDGDGKKELGFNTYSGVEFFNYSPAGGNLSAPANIDAWALSSNSAFLKWSKVSGADKYEIYYFLQPSSPSQSVDLTKLTETASDTISLFSLKAFATYNFVVKPVNTQSSITDNPYSEAAKVYLREPIHAGDSIYTETGNSIVLPFSGKLANNYMESAVFELRNTDGEFVDMPVTANVANDTNVILTFAKKLYSGDYLIKYRAFRDYYNNYSISGITKLKANTLPNPDELRLLKLNLYDPLFIQVQFSDVPDSASASNPDNYVIKPHGAVMFAARVPTELDKVELNISTDGRPLPLGYSYSLTAKNITTQSGKKMTKGVGSTLGFVLSESGPRNAYVFPNPIKLSANDDIMIGGLPAKAKIEILTTEGKVLATLYEYDSNGGTRWSGLDDAGGKLKPGVYYAKVTDTTKISDSSDFEFIKFAIVP